MGIVGVVLALLYLMSNVSMMGWGLLCADAIWLSTRVEVVENAEARAGP